MLPFGHINSIWAFTEFLCPNSTRTGWGSHSGNNSWPVNTWNPQLESPMCTGLDFLMTQIFYRCTLAKAVSVCNLQMLIKFRYCFKKSISSMVITRTEPHNSGMLSYSYHDLHILKKVKSLYKGGMHCVKKTN